jgi:hypothetical protein
MDARDRERPLPQVTYREDDSDGLSDRNMFVNQQGYLYVVDDCSVPGLPH